MGSASGYDMSAFQAVPIIGPAVLAIILLIMIILLLQSWVDLYFDFV